MSLFSTILNACRLSFSPSREKGLAGEAWVAWRAGEFTTAKSIAQDLMSDDKTNDAALEILAMVAHITGDYAGAVANFENISPDAKSDVILLEAVFESLLHLGHAPEAFDMVKDAVAQSPEYQSYYNRAKSMAEYPLRTEIEQISILPFVQSEITDYMPGVTISLNGTEITARLDTGGDYIVMSSAQAKKLGIEANACTQSFGNLQTTKTCIGIVKQLTLGNANLYNVPVRVMDALDDVKVSELDISLIIGTNIFQKFLTTIDTPNQRLILSKRNDKKAKQEHLSYLKGTQQTVPFIMWASHFMIAQGAIATQEKANFFIDSGLVAGTPELGQAHVLASKFLSKKWQKVGKTNFAKIPNTLKLGTLVQNNSIASIVPNKTWQAFEEQFGGIGVDALLSYGFLKNYAWTLDFDTYTYIFTKKAASN